MSRSRWRCAPPPPASPCSTRPCRQAFCAPRSPAVPAVPSVPPTPESLPDDLTPREADVLRAIAGGQTNAEIAKELYISEVTVKSHINHLFAKIGSRSRAEAVSYAYDHGLVAPPS